MRDSRVFPFFVILLMLQVGAAAASLVSPYPAQGQAVRRVFLRILVVASEGQAQALWEQLRQGEAFEELARRHSLDPTASQGGYLGEVWLENLNASFREQVLQLQEGEFSPPFRSGRDWVILYRLPGDFRTRAYRLEKKGANLLQQDRVEEAVAALQEAVSIYPDFAQGYFTLGLAYARKGDREREKASYQRAIEIAPEFHHAHFNLGETLMSEGDVTGAIRAFQQVVRIKPDEAPAWVNLSALYLRRGDREGAVEAARKAVESNPLLASAHYNLGVALGVEGLEEALESFERAVLIDPARLDARLNAAIALAHVGRHQEAVARLEKLQEEHPEFKPVQETLARLREEQASLGSGPQAPSPAGAPPPAVEELVQKARQALGQGWIEEAVKQYDEALRLSPASQEIREERAWSLVALGRELQAKGQWKRAVEVWNQVLLQVPAFVPALEALAEVFIIQGDFSLAERYLQQALGREPQNPRLIILKSRLEYERRNLEASFAELKKLRPEQLEIPTSLKLAEQLLYLDLDEQAFKLLGRLQLQPHQKLEAANILVKFSKFEKAEELLKELPGSSGRLLLGRLYSSQLRFEEAEGIFRELIRESPEAWPPYYFLGQVFLDAGDGERAVSVLQEAHRLAPDNVNVLYKLGQAHAQSGRLQEAVRWLEKGLELEPEAFQLNFEMGKILLEMGELTRAKTFFYQVLKQEPDHIRTHYLLGRLYQQAGDRLSARSFLQKFAELKRRLEEGRQRLKEMKEALKGRTVIS